MRKFVKPKKDKIPKITEAEYAAYLSALKSMTEGADGGYPSDAAGDTQGKQE